MSAAFGVVEQAIARGPIPGAAAAVGDAEREDRACFGVLEPGGARVTEDAWYDLASLTKVLVIMPLCLEWISGCRIDQLAHDLFSRLSLAEELAYEVPADAAVAPTEHCPWRGRLLRGEVHDENAAALGGVAPHAGLFGTLRGVSAYARA